MTSCVHPCSSAEILAQNNTDNVLVSIEVEIYGVLKVSPNRSLAHANWTWRFLVPERLLVEEGGEGKVLLTDELRLDLFCDDFGQGLTLLCLVDLALQLLFKDLLHKLVGDLWTESNTGKC